MRFWSSSKVATHPLVKAIQERSQYTPDYRELSQYEKQLLFAYTTKATVLECSPSVVTGWTFDKFQVWTNGEDIVPLPRIKKDIDDKINNVKRYRSFGGVEPRRIVGRVVSLSPKAFVELDKSRENGVSFLRQRVRIIVPYLEYERQEKEGLNYNSCEDKVTFVRTWMYVGVKENWNIDLKTGRLIPIDTINKAAKVGDYFEIK